MKTALITTTVNVPRVLELYRKLGPDVRFFVALDKKSADLNPWIKDLMARGAGDSNTIIFASGAQEKWKCSELLGWNNDSRRNIALLEAVAWGAEIIVSVDDDMIPCAGDLFAEFKQGLSQPFLGLELGAPDKWFDAGRYAIPQARQRGLPIGCATDNSVSIAFDAEVGAMQGIILGTPDTDAATTIADEPRICGVTDILRNGFVVDPQAKAVFNSQFTAFRRELAPCFAQFYKWQGRNTDIFASLIMRRIMRDLNLHTYYGLPMGFHARTPRDPLKDLKAEMWGLEYVACFSDIIDAMELRGDTVVAKLRELYQMMKDLRVPWWPMELTDAAYAFLGDIEPLM